MRQGVARFFSDLISVFVSEILEIRSGYIAPTFTTPATGLIYRRREEGSNCRKLHSVELRDLYSTFLLSVG